MRKLKTTANKALCAVGLHDWLFVYEDELERLYSCRRDHGEDLCPELFVVEKGPRPAAYAKETP